MSDALQNVRRLIAWSRETGGAAPSLHAVPTITTVGIIGAGLMGRAIAGASARQGLSVVLCDLSEEVLSIAAAEAQAGIDVVDAGVRPAVLVHTTLDPSEATQCDLVLESIVESLAAKQRLYQQVQGNLGKGSILASNTSTIPIRRLADGLADASRFCGIHFFHPVQERMLVEVVRGPQTGADTIAAALSYVRAIGRTAIVVDDGPGFVVNRLLFPYLGEALQLLREGVPAALIERAATDFGMTVGPLRFMDEIGLDTTLHAGWVLGAAFPDRIVPSPLLVALVKAGRKGQKAGRGFYAYVGQRDRQSPPEREDPGRLDPVAERIVAEWLDASPLPSDAPLSLRLVLPMLLEATRIIEERRVRDIREIDLAVLLGLGFPAAKGGLLWWADTLGAERVVQLLSDLAPAGLRFRPTPILAELVRSGGRFYPR
jgi:3-hydroxyacyl-CoA dehydrogenase